jgi:hypothetical protein
MTYQYYLDTFPVLEDGDVPMSFDGWTAWRRLMAAETALAEARRCFAADGTDEASAMVAAARDEYDAARTAWASAPSLVDEVLAVQSRADAAMVAAGATVEDLALARRVPCGDHPDYPDSVRAAARRLQTALSEVQREALRGASVLSLWVGARPDPGCAIRVDTRPPYHSALLAMGWATRAQTPDEWTRLAAFASDETAVPVVARAYPVDVDTRAFGSC